MPNFAKVGRTVPEIWPIFDFSRWRPPPSWILNVSNFQIFGTVTRVELRLRANFVEIAQTTAEIWRFFNFSTWRPSAILDLFYVCWYHPRRVFGGLCDCAKFGCNRCNNFDSMQILISCTLSLKLPIHAPKIGFFLRDFTLKMGSSMNETPKSHNPSTWAGSA